MRIRTFLTSTLAAATVLSTGALSAPAASAASGADWAVAADGTCTVRSMKPYVSGPTTRQLARTGSAQETTTTATDIRVDWETLEPVPNVYSFAEIDSQLATAKAQGKQVRLRVLAGTRAPAYAKSIGGAPLPYADHQQQTQETIGRFWTDAYQQRWRALMTKLAARYDNDSAIREVNIAGTGAISAEVFLIMPNDEVTDGRTNRQVLIDAGMTDAARLTALKGDIDFMQGTWKKTHTTLWAHPMQTLYRGANVEATKEIIDWTYTLRMGHTVFGHTGTSSDTLQGITHPDALEMYQHIIANKYPFTLQTQSYNGGGGVNEGVGDLPFVLNWMGSNTVMGVELPSGFENDTAFGTSLASTMSQTAKVMATNQAATRSTVLKASKAAYLCR